MHATKSWASSPQLNFDPRCADTQPRSRHLIVASEFLHKKPSVKPSVRDRRNGVEEEEALRTCEELFAATQVLAEIHITPPVYSNMHLQAQRNIPIPIRVVLLEHIRHPLQANARLHKQIEAQHLLPLAVVAAAPRLVLRVRAEQQLHELRAQAVPERDQGVLELAQRNRARAVRVEAIEKAAPRRQETPQPAELVEVDRAAAVSVEHADHHLHRVHVEGRVVAVDECAPQLFFRQLPAAVFVDL